MQDLQERLHQLSTIQQHLQSSKLLASVWLGGLFHPEAFITATRQHTAHQTQASLEKLVLDLVPHSPASTTPHQGIQIDGGWRRRVGINLTF